MPKEQKVTRKLRAILSADVKGYSLLMADDEVHTIQTLKIYRQIMSDLIQHYSGRVVDNPGDNLLAEFGSAVDAIECAYEIQNRLKKENAKFIEKKQLQFRIGINIGDVVQDGDRIYGSGVNVAARIEGLADAGGVCVSRNVYDQTKDKLTLGFEYLGNHDVKNIKDPVRVYKVLMDPEDVGKLIGDKPAQAKNKWFLPAAVVAAIIVTSIVWNLVQSGSKPDFEPASLEKMAFKLPEKPSIAVLPFNNISGDSTQDYISDGISENIIADLSKISEMFVIASNSTFTYKGKPVKIQQISEDLGVRYVLQGSTHKIEDRLRITTQLIDATTGHHLWSEKYNREMKDFFALQDEITHKVIVELQVKLTEGEQARISHRSTKNLEAWSYAVRGLKLFERTSKENNAKAMEFFEQAVELDPGYVWAWVRLAWTHVVAGRPGWSQSPSESLEKAFEISEKVLAMDESDSDVKALSGLVCLLKDQYEQAIFEGEKSIKLSPTNAQAHVLLAVTMYNVGRFDDAIELVKKAMRLHPYYPAYYLQWLGGAYRMTGHYDDAIGVYKQLLERSIKGEFPITGAHLFLAEVYAESGRENEGRIHLAEVLKLRPKFSIKDVTKIRTYRFKDSGLLESRLNALRKAGLPEHPPLELPEKPSIVVLPFLNMSNDPKQEYFSDGMTDELISDLAKIKDILVISRNSAFTYKGKSIKIQQVAQDLNVRYILEGSVQRSGSKVRIRAQLIDGKTDHHVWSESYDGVMDDIFALQDKITKKIVSALFVTLTTDEQDRISGKGTDSIQAYEAYLKGFEHYSRMTGDNLIKAIKYYREATKIDPNFSRAYSGLATAYYMSTTFNYPWQSEAAIMSDVRNFKIKARHYLNIAKENPTWETYVIAAYMDVSRKRFDEAVLSAEKALLEAPNQYLVNIAMGYVLTCVGRAREALKYLDTAMRLDPRILDILLVEKGKAFFLLGEYEKAVTFIQKGLTLNPALTNYSSFEAASHAFLGDIKKAKDAWYSFVEGFPIKSYLSTKHLYYFFPFKDHKIFDHFIEGLNKAGFEGNQSDYYKVEKINRLSGQKIKELLFGKIVTSYDILLLEFSYQWTLIGDLELTYYSGVVEKGKSRIEGDSICHQFEYFYDGIKACMDVYYITQGNDVAKNQFLSIDDSWLSTISIKE